MTTDRIKIIECPRDAMQGWDNLISTENKIRYIRQLMKIGFDTIDFGSFVSHEAIPQMADTEEVANNLVNEVSQTKLLAIIANYRGAQDAARHANITYLGYPFSVSPTFQMRNANSTIEESYERVREIQQLCVHENKTLVVYLSMAFGNPYGDDYSEAIVIKTAEAIAKMGVQIISLADTVGLATPGQVEDLCKAVIPEFPDHEIGLHLHSTGENRKAKLDAALNQGCRRFDGAILGYGGCPMSGNALVGNMDTGWMVRYFNKEGYMDGINMEALGRAEKTASQIFI